MWWGILYLLKVCQWFYVWKENSYIIAEVEVSCSWKHEKFIIESLRYRKTTSRCFCYEASLNLSISYTFRVSSYREVFLVNSCLRTSVSFYRFFFVRKIFEKYLYDHFWQLYSYCLQPYLTLKYVTYIFKHFEHSGGTLLLWRTNFYHCC